MTFRVLHHDRCFDGACSAAMFTRFHRQCIGGADAYEYAGLAHAPGGQVDPSVFGPGENAIVDFKYTSSPRLTWWFDHHETAFPTPADRARFDAGQAGDRANREFFDPSAISCTGFIARVAASRFGFDISRLTELLYWADIVDGARFRSAQMAVEMKEPALQLALTIENAADGFIPRVIPLLTEMSMEEIVAQPFIAETIAPLMARNAEQMELVRERAVLDRGTIFLDLTDRMIEGMSKFLTYYLHPTATYAVVVTRSETKVKISVGTNPWTTHAPAELANISDICARFGGGGHARVGAISLGASDLNRAVKIAGGIASELRASS